MGDIVRDAGYEVLLAIAGLVAVSTRPTIRHGDAVKRAINELGEARRLAKLERQGLLARDDRGGGDVLRLTELGDGVLHGGRHPEQAWGRAWDGQWRLIAFDLPLDAAEIRSRFWRWLKANHFGNLQGSLWVTPDPVPSITSIAETNRFDPSAVLVFTGELAASRSASEIAGMAWDFGEINVAYRRYVEFADQSRKLLRGKTPLPSKSLRGLVRDDRRLWWAAVRQDPLLPRALHPEAYEAPRAWSARSAFHQALASRLASEVEE